MNNQKEIVPDLDYKEILPAMNVGVAPPPAPKMDNLISDEAMVGLYEGILQQINIDRTEIDDCIAKFADFVFNGGDATSASKEALVNLIKLKVEAADKMTKVADLMTRVKLKERDTFPRYLAAKQENTIHIGDNGAKEALLKAINKAQKKKDKQNDDE